MEVIPSLLTHDIGDYWNQVKRITPFYKHLQVDIADGLFVSGTTISLDNILSTFELDYVTSNPIFDFDLLVKNYEKTIDKIGRLNDYVMIDLILIHFKNHPDIQRLQDKYGFKLGIALDPDDSVEQFLQKYDKNLIFSVQIMTVNPGAQGQDFIPEMLDKIEQLRLAGYRNKIYLDGAINEKSLPIIFSKKYKPDVICPGSYFSKAERLEERVAGLKNMLQADNSYQA